jgi:hypothetical protein
VLCGALKTYYAKKVPELLIELVSISPHYLAIHYGLTFL